MPGTSAPGQTKDMSMARGVCLFALVALVSAAPALAQDTRISPDRDTLTFTLNGSAMDIARAAPLPCPPACIQPLSLGGGITTLGELELLDFLESHVAAGTGLLIDVRPPAAFAAATIPGAVSIPEAILRPENPYRADLLAALGVAGSDASAAYDLVLFADSAAVQDAPDALNFLRDTGYPADKLHYYRAGLQGWSALGLSTRPGS